MLKPKPLCQPFLTLACVLFYLAVAVPAQQTDPFYTNLLEKAERSFLARNYEAAGRDFEVAAFGLAGNKTLRGKAYVYLSLCHYHMKDMSASEKSMQEAAAIMKEEGFSKLAIADSARPTLEMLLAFFGIAQPQNEPLPADAAGAAKAAKEEGGLPSPDKKPGEKADGAGSPSSDPPAPQKPVVRLDELKEGDIVPLELVDAPPAAIKRFPAVYPNYIGAKTVEGTVTVNALVSENGAVVRTEIKKGLKDYAGFDQAALRAVQQWKFEPASVKGIRVKVWLPVAIEFKKRS